MADEQDKWLDRDAAERLLRGEPLEGVDPHVRARADRLAQALGALAATDGPTAPGDADAGAGAGAAAGELPGEAAALAAFRAARAESAREESVRAGHRSAAYATSAHEAAAAETVRLSRAADRPRPSRWGKPVRFGLAAALAGCMIGGVAVAASSGVLPSPFGGHGGHGEPGPVASASSVATPEEPRTSPSSRTREPAENLVPDDTTPPDDGPTREPDSRTPPAAEADGGHSDGVTRQPGPDATLPRTDGKDWYRTVLTSCRAYRSGELRGTKRRHLEEAARGSARLDEFCGRVLGGTGGGHGNGGGHGGSGGGGHHDEGDGRGQNGSGGDTDGAPVPPPGLPGPTPTGSYSALPTLPHH
ncbi:hypothetical protein [Streptomyces sp. NRRL S-920]|uniref:hypothetical protein n=1 Tax=Streptomyces sp. NRRL S-920 TaxID=1463921 RepID=UPI0006913946|nr:hypothetical protein [Streptomyces sp. NRRL S-920]